MSTYERFECKNRPVILCEYSHAMGNSNGELVFRNIGSVSDKPIQYRVDSFGILLIKD